MKYHEKEIDIIKILKEIALNKHENYKIFRERFTEYCSKNENAVIVLFRLLKNMEIELNDCLNGNFQVDVDRTIIIKVLKIIRIELDIIKYRMKYPELFVQKQPDTLHPVGVWTNDKIDLIELIYAVKMSINNGNVTIKSLQDAFEYIFQVKLGNIYDRVGEINDRKGQKATYLGSLIKYLNKFLDGLK